MYREVPRTLWRDRRPCKRDLGNLEHWATINGMKLNKKKCQILHPGQSTDGHKYKLGEEQLESSPAERDPGGCHSTKGLIGVSGARWHPRGRTTSRGASNPASPAGQKGALSCRILCQCGLALSILCGSGHYNF